MTNSNSFYDDLDCPNNYSATHDTNHALDPKTFERHIRNEATKNACFFMLMALRAIINEQIEVGLLNKEEADYILEAMKDQCLRKGWMGLDRLSHD